MFKVIRSFSDTLDNGHIYHKGDTFPREGVSASSDRVEELSSTHNKTKRVLIAEIPDSEEELVGGETSEDAYTKTKIRSMLKGELLALAKTLRIANCEEMNVATLKEALLEKLEL